MSKLDDAMSVRMTQIVCSEYRPFSYFDFDQFVVDGHEYHMTHGTFRNKILALKKHGKVKLAYRSNVAYYTLKGMIFKAPMTFNHVGVPSRKAKSLYDEISNLPLHKNSLHDIRLWFKIKGIWSVLSTNSSIRMNPRNKDIRLPGINIDDLFISQTVHRTDTMSVIVGCTYAPIAVDIAGVIRLSNALTRVEERLSRVIEQDGLVVNWNPSRTGLIISPHMKWIVKMWHFGADGKKEYGGEKFEVTFADAQEVLTRIYAKQMKDGKKRIRLERQEYPNKSLADAIEEKLNSNNGVFDHGSL